MAVYEKLCECVGAVSAMKDQQYDDNMVQRLESSRRHRADVVEVWFKSIFPPVRFDDG